MSSVMPSAIQRGTPAYLRANLALFLAGFATFSLLYCVQPLLPAFARTFQISPAESSLAMSLSTSLLAFAILVAAIISSSVKRRLLMGTSMVLASVLNIVAGLVPDWHTLLASRALTGLVLGGVPAVAMAYLAEEIDHSGLGMAMGLYVAGTGVGGLFGRVAAAGLSEYFDWHAAMLVLGIVNLLTAVGFIALLPSSRNFTPRPPQGLRHHLGLWGAHLRQPGLPRLFLMSFTVMGCFVTIYNYVGFHLMEAPYLLSQTQIGIIFMANIFGIVSSSIAGGLADRHGRAPVLIVGIVCMLLGLALSLHANLAVLLLGVVVLTAGFFIAHAVASAWVGRLAQGAKGHASSLYLLTYYIGSSTMGSVGGWFWEYGHWPGVAALGGALMLLALAVAISLRPLDRKGPPPSAAPHTP